MAVRQLNLADGFSSATPPEILATGLSVYASDAAFVVANGAAQAGDVYFNSTTGEIRFYSNISSSWESIVGGLKVYADDAAYVTANGPAVGGDEYYNNTEGTVRYYDDVAATWRKVGGGVAYQELIGTGNGVLSSFPLTLVPSDENSVLVLANTVAFNVTEYSYNQIGNTIDFVSPPASGVQVYAYYLTEGQSIVVPSPTGTENVPYFTLSSTDISNGYITLAATPAVPAKTMLDVIGGTSQEYGVDFQVVGAQLQWTGMGLDGVLIAGDKLRVHFYN